MLVPSGWKKRGPLRKDIQEASQVLAIFDFLGWVLHVQASGFVVLMFFFKPYVDISHTVTHTHTMKITQPLHHNISPAVIMFPVDTGWAIGGFFICSQLCKEGKTKFFINIWCFVLPWELLPLLLDSWGCRGQSQSPAVVPYCFLGSEGELPLTLVF